MSEKDNRFPGLPVKISGAFHCLGAWKPNQIIKELVNGREEEKTEKGKRREGGQ